MENFFFDLKLIKLLSILNILYSWRPLGPEISHLNFKKHEKNCNFPDFADIKRHNFKYIGQFLTKFGHNNIGSLSFGIQSVLLENLSPLMFYRLVN